MMYRIRVTIYVYIQIKCEVVKTRCIGCERQYLFIYKQSVKLLKEDVQDASDSICLHTNKVWSC